MKSFKELIANGIAPTHVTEWGTMKANNIANTEQKMIIDYNNMFGICNDTHLDFCNGSYCITGSFVADTKKFDVFLHSKSYRNVDFQCTPGEFFRLHNLCGDYEYQNGQLVYKLTQCE